MTPIVNGHGSSMSSMHSPSPNSRHSTPPPPPEPVQRDSRQTSRLNGTVKWFNAKAGYGFIKREDNGEDVFIHFSGIARKNPRHLIKSLGDGEPVEFNILATNVTGPRGMPVLGNPYVSHIPIRRADSFASGDPVMFPPQVRRYNFPSRIPRWNPSWQR